MEVLLPNAEIVEGLYFLAYAAKDIDVLFFSYVVFLVLSVIKAGLLTSLDFITPGEIYLAYTQPLYLLSFLTPPYPPIVQLSPYFITGFSDGEGCYFIGISPNSKLSAGYRVKVSFQIGLHENDRALLELIKTSLGVGSITKQDQKSIQYRVTSIKELKVILSHF
jgi:hypothetical protein